ncbi:SH3 domain-containing protein [Oceanobacillus locisalsi]|uniref:SH3 domain-containing protein n=1 Tax=Oceanobacillus locisalsi TaxID=546107 RepID=A0ABW3NHQ2_9BACI
MRKSSKFRLLLLFIAGVVFIAFVLIMQRQFNNPDFDFQNETADVSTTESDEETEETDTDIDTTDTSESEEDAGDEAEASEEETESDDEEDHQVTAEQLNIRSSPSADSEVVATLTTDDVVQVIGEQDEYEWIEVAFDDVTGYVNAGYLEPVD